MKFNPYTFPQRTYKDNCFYCNQHVHEFMICKRKNDHVKQYYFDVELARQECPEVMEIMEFHGISKFMNSGRKFSPTLLGNSSLQFIYPLLDRVP